MATPHSTRPRPARPAACGFDPAGTMAAWRVSGLECPTLVTIRTTGLSETRLRRNRNWSGHPLAELPDVVADRPVSAEPLEAETDNRRESPSAGPHGVIRRRRSSIVPQQREPHTVHRTSFFVRRSSFIVARPESRVQCPESLVPDPWPLVPNPQSPAPLPSFDIAACRF